MGLRLLGELGLVGGWLLCAEVLWEAADLWFRYDPYSHGFFILPVTAALLWMGRAPIKAAVVRPTLWGIFPLILGLLMETSGYLLRIRFAATLSLIPVLAGLVLLLHGRDLWRNVRFHVWFLAFAAPIPGMLLTPSSNWIQHLSSPRAAL